MSAPQEHRQEAPTELGFGLVTVSDTRHAGDDVSGERMAELVESAGHRVEERLLIADETAPLRSAVSALLARGDVDVVVVSGGTGVSPRDVTVEALGPLFERELPGFGELFRMLSYREIGAAAMLSRATAGLTHGRAVFLLPGSPAAVELAMRELVLPEAAHLVGQARRPGRPSRRAEA